MNAGHVFEDFYVSHHQWLYAWLRKKLGCQFQAADLTHDTFLRILNSGDLPELQQPRAFLTTTATRIMIDMMRRRQLEQSYLQHLQLSAHQQWVDSPEQIQSALQTLFAIASMLDALPERPRQAFLMSRLDNLSHAEIAERLGVSVARVRQYLTQVILKCCVITAD